VISRFSVIISMILILSGCTYNVVYEKFTPHTFVEYNLTDQDIEDIQFYLEAPITLRDANLPKANKSISSGNPSKEMKDIVIISEKTKGIFSDIGKDWIELSFNDDIILRFVPSDPKEWYRLTHLNGQEISEGKIIMYNDRRYIVAFRHFPSKLDEEKYFSEIPYLYFDLERFLKIKRESKTISGKKL